MHVRDAGLLGDGEGVCRGAWRTDTIRTTLKQPLHISQLSPYTHTHRGRKRERERERERRIEKIDRKRERERERERETRQ